MRIAPDSKTLTGFPWGPSGSTIAGIFPFGLIFRNSGSNCCPLRISTIVTTYGSAISSSATLILRPLGVSKACSSMGMERPRALSTECSCQAAMGGAEAVVNVASLADLDAAMQVGLDTGEDQGIADLYVRADCRRRSRTERVAHPAA